MLTHDILLLSPALPCVGHEFVYFTKLVLAFQPRFSGFDDFFIGKPTASGAGINERNNF
jgi:hypothetical protein